MINNQLLTNKGFTLLEVMAAIFVITVGVIGGMTAVQKTITLISISSSRLIAAYLVQEGIEIVRNIRDTNWLEGRAAEVPWDEGLQICSAGCEGDYTMNQSLVSWQGGYLNIDNNNFYSYSSGNPTKFKRKITISKLEPDILEVQVKVTWSERGMPQSLSAKEYLYKWK
ncbi:MAG: prepilin-type N-terminal cleavage/methylation domain-containing protein [Patescibacteria group bacterium]|nr:prepilin-type N-terminal cleavage/methylation domain-containing protein [Patescibacteria group bacterium]